MNHQAGPGGGSPASGATGDGGAGAGAEQTGAEQTRVGQAGADQASMPETGEPRVDAALELLGELPGLPVTDHAAVFERVQAELSEVLGELDPESAGTDG